MLEYSKLFTDTEAIALYNSLKIKFNPHDYSFKDRLIFDKNLISHSMLMFDFTTESELLNMICSKLKIHHGDIHIHDYFDNTYSTTWFNEITFSLDPAFIYKNNLLIDLEKIFNGFKLNPKYYVCLKNPEIAKGTLLESIITLCISLKKSNSLVHNLKWLMHDKYIFVDLNDLNDLTFLEPEVCKNNDNLQILFNSMNETHYVPINNPSIGNDAILGVMRGIKLSDYDDDEIPNECALEMIQKGFFEAIVFGFEILHHIESLENEIYKNTLKDLICADYNTTSVISTLYTTSCTGEFNLNSEISDIVLENNPKVRFDKIVNYIKRTNLIDNSKEWAKQYCTDSSLSIPYFFGQFLMYAEDLGIQTIRTKIVISLYEICRKNNIDFESTKSDTENSMSSFIEKTDTSGISGISDTSSESKFSKDSKKTRSSMMGKPHIPSTGTGEMDGGLKSGTFSTTLEALDKVKASFEDNGYKFDVSDKVDFECKKDYDIITDSIHLINQDLIKKIRDIKTYNEGGKNPGMKTGKLDRKNIYKYKTSKDIFYNNTYKIKESDLAFGIILDVSGSMYGKGIENGRITMIILHETLKALGINHSIITHTTHEGYHTCEIKRYQAFKEDATYNVKKNYALASIRAESGNCDSAALYYMEKALNRVRNKDKICIIFSDGQPTECSDTELKDQVRHMEHNGIKVIGIGINFESIKYYYKDNANGRNLKEMLDIVSNILKEYILKKED